MFGHRVVLGHREGCYPAWLDLLKLLRLPVNPPEDLTTHKAHFPNSLHKKLLNSDYKSCLQSSGSRQTRVVYLSHCGLAIYPIPYTLNPKPYLKAKEELWKSLKYFTMQKYNLPKIL
jgi:hypothetical protein